MLADGMMALAVLAGNTVVTAATTDAWEAACRGFSRLLGRGDADRKDLSERRLAETRGRLTSAVPADLDEVRASLETRWTGRFADLLEEDPSVEAELRAEVERIRAALVTTVSAVNSSVAVGRDLSVSADRGGFAAGVIYGHVGLPDPTRPGTALS
jgi:hypothetical protein